MKDNNLLDRAISASARYCELKGYEVLEHNWSPEDSEESVPLIAYDEDALVFIDVKVRIGFDGFIPESETDREAMEVLAARYLTQAELESNVEVRFDIISMMVVSEDRAMLKLDWQHLFGRFRQDQPRLPELDGAHVAERRVDPEVVVPVHVVGQLGLQVAEVGEAVPVDQLRLEYLVRRPRCRGGSPWRRATARCRTSQA